MRGGERAREGDWQRSQSFCNPISEVTSRHFCHTVLVRSKSLGPANAQAERMIQRHEYQRSCIVETILKGVYHNCIATLCRLYYNLLNQSCIAGHLDCFQSHYMPITFHYLSHAYHVLETSKNLNSKATLASCPDYREICYPLTVNNSSRILINNVFFHPVAGILDQRDIDHLSFKILSNLELTLCI